MLGGKCSACKSSISILYPFIELITALCLSALYLLVPLVYFPAYFFFFSALLVSIRTDLETMLVSRFVTLFLVPSGILFAYLGFIPLSTTGSIAGATFGYLLLRGVALIFYHMTKKEGLGLGDVELLAFIGSYTGILGCWLALLIGSITGSVAGITHMISTGSNKIPFGPFLALGAITYVLLQPTLLRFFFGL